MTAKAKRIWLYAACWPSGAVAPPKLIGSFGGQASCGPSGTSDVESSLELSPRSDFSWKWILFQEQYQRARREQVFGSGGLFGGSKIVMYQDDGLGVLRPVSDEDAATAWAAQDAQEDAHNESLALRLDQYELNRDRLVYLCTVKEDLRDVAAIIEGGMPPQVRPGIVEAFVHVGAQ
jgi:hypothetical protein